MKYLMVDIETLGTSFNSVITQIGACYFTPRGKIGDKFLVNINIQSCLDYGLKVDGDTLEWWFERANLISWLNETVPLTKALDLFREFCYKNKKAKIWSHDFDFKLLQCAYRKIKQGLPFSYRNWRDIRTLVELSGLKKKKRKVSKCCNAEVEVVNVESFMTQYYVCKKCSNPCDIIGEDPKTHNALEDCIYQVGYVCECFKKLNIK